MTAIAPMMSSRRISRWPIFEVRSSRCFPPVSNAVVVGNQCWISGQLSVGDDGAYAPGTAREEAERAFAHVFRIAEAAGFSRSGIVYVDLAFVDLADVNEVNALYGELFSSGQRPARTIYQAAKLPFGGKVKVQAVAARE